MHRFCGKEMNERSFLLLCSAIGKLMTAPALDLRPTTDARVAEILASARVAFAEKGFDGASMQDLAKSVGMSVGNFYRYFPSKAAIVEAIVMGDMAEMDSDFKAIITSDDPMLHLRTTIRQRVSDEGNCADDGRLWAEITAAALRKPELGAVTQRMEFGIVGYLCAVFAQATGLTLLDAEARYAAHARLIVMLVKAMGMESSQPGRAHDELIALVQRIIDKTLDEIAMDQRG
jgi:AcrR family transcriptional regulator